MSDKHATCIYCGNTRGENGKWTAMAGGQSRAMEAHACRTICSSCSARRFPQYYGDGSKPGTFYRLKCQWLNIISHLGQ